MRRLAILLVAVSPVNAGCSEQPPATIDWQPAALLLDAKLHDAEKDRSKVPRLANPEDAPFLRALFDLDGIWAMDGKDFAAIGKRCDPVLRIGRRYSALAVNAAHPEKLDYQDELALGSAAYLLCRGKEAQAIEQFAAALPAGERTPSRRDQAREAGERTIGFVTTVIRDSTGPAYASTANHWLVLDALAKAAPFLARTLSLDQRKGVLNAIDRQWDRITVQDRTRVTTIRHAFEDTGCGTMCTDAG